MLRSLAGVAAALALAAPARPAAAQQPAPRPSAGATRPAGSPARAAAAAAPRPTLLVFLTVDQMRADYLTTRFGAQLTGGLRRLRDGGALFTNAHQDHAITETAPGHASTLSGRFPASTGIFRNAAGVQDPQAPLLDGGATGPASPFRFRGSALVDWLRAADPRTRALSVSRKDRGAILPLGRAKQQAFWYGGNGRFTTSRYYADTLPDWVKAVNARDFGRRYAGRAWTPLLAASAYPEADSVPVENNGRDYAFPHVLPGDPARAAAALPDTPWMDEATLEAALAGADALGLGRGPQTDVLAVSLSATDAVGHRYGMDSRELHDQVLRLDRSLGAFVDSLYKTRDSARVVFALTGDHGMAPYPELHFPGTDPNRGHADLREVLRTHNGRLPGRDGFDVESGAIVQDTAAFRAAGVDPRAALLALAADLRRVRGVAYVMTRDALPALAAQRRDTSAAKYARRWLHMIPPDLPVAAVVTLEPYAYYGGITYATHGSPHDYDSHVPVLFHGAAFRPGRYARFARVVDMAPTLAAVLGVAPTEPLDGRVLRDALRAPPAVAAAPGAAGAPGGAPSGRR
jgi:predicted AlkP superfamily pyrophosphatase or phosphodiesterase